MTKIEWCDEDTKTLDDLLKLLASFSRRIIELNLDQTDSYLKAVFEKDNGIGSKGVQLLNRVREVPKGE